MIISNVFFVKKKRHKFRSLVYMRIYLFVRPKVTVSGRDNEIIFCFIVKTPIRSRGSSPEPRGLATIHNKFSPILFVSAWPIRCGPRYPNKDSPFPQQCPLALHAFTFVFGSILFIHGLVDVQMCFDQIGINLVCSYANFFFSCFRCCFYSFSSIHFSWHGRLFSR